MLSETQQQMVALFEKHIGAELEGDLDTTMATMSDDPHLNHVPTMAGASAGTVSASSIVIILSASSFRRM